jgi:hypothetical protein
MANIDNRKIVVGSVSEIASSKKQVADIFLYTFDLTDWLNDEDTVLSATVTASPTGVGHLTVSVGSLSPTAVRVLASAGVDNTIYTVTVRATTSGGQLKETELSLHVLDFPSVVS